jgi:putative nucleotidyltransferase with HDIG domain
MERRTMILATPEELRSHPLYDGLLVDEHFTCCIAEPLIAKGQVIGVLEVFQRVPLNPDPDWQEFLVSLAGQAAIAVDNAQLLDKLQRSNIELASAYDATIEGWSRALDLRDKETEGHTQRVTLWTEHLAREMKVPEEDILHIRRGALLHDIGKMGIPDNILLKPGPLTKEEWEIMRKHPEYASQLLSPIQFLRPALAIPYSHHERWDGKGYPHGLKGERIPLPARMFTLVDVWDALTSDRPYRAAWAPQKTLEYIETQSGTMFDPAILRVFLRLIRGS